MGVQTALAVSFFLVLYARSSTSHCMMQCFIQTTTVILFLRKLAACEKLVREKKQEQRKSERNDENSGCKSFDF
jgi:hypothetical protein